jgi:hypothetical protein
MLSNHHYLIPEPIHHPKKETPDALAITVHPPPPPAPGNH